MADPPAIDAIRAHRARWNLRLLWRVLWRLLVAFAVLVVLEVDLLVDDLAEDGLDAYRIADTDERLRMVLIGLTVVAVIAASGVHILRVLRSRVVEVPPTRTFRGIPGPGAVLVAAWWVLPFWAIGLESRSNNDGWGSWIALDALAIALLVVGAVLPKLRSTVALDHDELRWRGPVGTFVPGATPETDVVPISWESGLLRIAFQLVGVTIWIMAFTVAGSIGAIVVAALWFAFRWMSSRAIEERTWRWRDLRVVALEGGSPAVLAVGEGVLDLAPMVAATSRNERMVWTIATLTQRAGAGDGVETLDDQVRQVARDAARAERPHPTGPTTFEPTVAHSFRGRLNSTPSLVVGVIVVALFGWRAASGDTEALVTFVAVVLTLVVVFATLAIRTSRLRLEVTASELVVRGVRRARRIPIDSIGAIVGVPVMQTPAPGEVKVFVDGVVVDRDGEFLLRLRGGDWSPEQVDALAAAVGAPTTVIQDVLPITTLAHSFPGYAPTWEREPGKFGVILALAIIAIVAVGVLAFQGHLGVGGDDHRDSSSPFVAEMREYRALRDELDELVARTFPVSETEGGSPTGCVAEAGGAGLLDDCELAPALRRAVAAVAGTDADAAVATLCRCEPSRFGFAYVTDVTDPSLPPDEPFAPQPDRMVPRLSVTTTLIEERGPLDIVLDVVRDPTTGARTIVDVRCVRGSRAPLSAARAGATPESLRCEVEPDPERD